METSLTCSAQYPENCSGRLGWQVDVRSRITRYSGVSTDVSSASSLVLHVLAGSQEEGGKLSPFEGDKVKVVPGVFFS